MWPPHYSVVIDLPVATLNIGYGPPNRRTRRDTLFGKGGKQVRERGLYEPQTSSKRVNEYGYRSKRSPKHTHTYPKSRVKVTLYDGTTFIDQYLKVEGRHHYFKAHGKIKSSRMYQMNILTKSDQIQQALDGSQKGNVDKR